MVTSFTCPFGVDYSNDCHHWACPSWRASRRQFRDLFLCLFHHLAAAVPEVWVGWNPCFEWDGTSGVLCVCAKIPSMIGVRTKTMVPLKIDILTGVAGVLPTSPNSAIGNEKALTNGSKHGHFEIPTSVFLSQ